MLFNEVNSSKNLLILINLVTDSHLRLLVAQVLLSLLASNQLVCLLSVVIMASEAEKTTKASEKSKKLTQEQIIATFNKLRQEQKSSVQKLTEVEQELNEHSLVVDALRDVDPDRVCYRMVGGVLVERTVSSVLPAVAHNKEQLTKLLEVLNVQIEAKGKEINDFKEKYNIQIRKDPPSGISESSKDEPSQASSSVLVKTES